MHVKYVLPVVLIGIASFMNGATGVLRVNGAEISDAQLKLAKSAFQARLQGRKVDDATLLKASVEQLIGRSLLVQAARDAKIAVEKAKVEESIARQRMQAGSPEAFTASLKRMDLTEADFFTMAEEGLLVERFVEQEVKSKLPSYDKEAHKYYDEHPQEFFHPDESRLRMMLFGLPQGVDEAKTAEVRARAAAALKRVQAGEDFAMVVNEVSEHQSKLEGGELGWMSKERLPQEVAAAVFGLKKGEISAVLEMKLGLCIFKVEDVRAAGYFSFTDVKSDLNLMMTNRGAEAVVQKIVTERRSKAKVEGLNPEMKKILEAKAQPPAPAPAVETKPAQTPPGAVPSQASPGKGDPAAPAPVPTKK